MDKCVAGVDHAINTWHLLSKYQLGPTVLQLLESAKPLTSQPASLHQRLGSCWQMAWLLLMNGMALWLLLSDQGKVWNERNPIPNVITDFGGFFIAHTDVYIFSCIFRVVDAYGTEAMYNDLDYALRHDYNSVYGQLGLNLKQFYTFYRECMMHVFFVWHCPLYLNMPQTTDSSVSFFSVMTGKRPSVSSAHSLA